MMQTILHAAENAAGSPFKETPETFAGRLSMAGITTLMGMVAVFAVLTIIMLIVMIMGKIIGGSSKKSAAKKEESPAPPPAQSAPEEAEAADDEEALVAAITAAIAAYRTAQGEQAGGFRVVSFRKTGVKPSWNKQ